MHRIEPHNKELSIQNVHNAMVEIPWHIEIRRKKSRDQNNIEEKRVKITN